MPKRIQLFKAAEKTTLRHFIIFLNIYLFNSFFQVAPRLIAAKATPASARCSGKIFICAKVIINISTMIFYKDASTTTYANLLHHRRNSRKCARANRLGDNLRQFAIVPILGHCAKVTLPDRSRESHYHCAMNRLEDFFSLSQILQLHQREKLKKKIFKVHAIFVWGNCYSHCMNIVLIPFHLLFRFSVRKIICSNLRLPANVSAQTNNNLCEKLLFGNFSCKPTKQ